MRGLFLVSDTAADRCYDQAVAPRPPMSEEQLKAFLEKVKGETSLQEKLNAAADSDAVLAIAKEAGFSISTDDLKNTQSDDISNKELEGAAGGGGHNCGFTAPRRDGRPATRMVRGPSCGRSH